MFAENYTHIYNHHQILMKPLYIYIYIHCVYLYVWIYVYIWYMYIYSIYMIYEICIYIIVYIYIILCIYIYILYSIYILYYIPYHTNPHYKHCLSSFLRFSELDWGAHDRQQQLRHVQLGLAHVSGAQTALLKPWWLLHGETPSISG